MHLTKVQWDIDAWEDYLYWQVRDKKVVKRINMLMKDICRNPYDGIGKPERLKGNLSGAWSRRIDEMNRIVYIIEDDSVIILECRGHYND